MLDDCREVIAEVKITPDQSNLLAYIPSSAKTIDSGLPAGKQWWHTKFEVEASRVRIYSKAMEDASYGQPWAQVLLSDLQVVGGPGLKLGGEGDLALRRIGVTPQSARGI